MQFNYNGLRRKSEEMVALMNREGISIGTITDTKLNSSLDLLSCADFNVIRKDRLRDRGEGFAYILHNTVDLTPECQGKAIWLGDKELQTLQI